MECFNALAPYQQQFIELAIEYNALKFGEFTLKSGRVSPYFFNAGAFNSGRAMAILGDCYAAAIVESGIEFDLIFGPAYKGIPLSAVTSAALYKNHGINTPVCYNRKEVKDHGEGGQLVGATLEGRVLVIDDVITAGTAIREVIGMMTPEARVCGVMIGLDRKEWGKQPGESAAMQIERHYQLQCGSIVTLEHIRAYLLNQPQYQTQLSALDAYWHKYGV